MMWLCQRIADWCQVNGSISEDEYPVVVYGLQVMFNSSIKIAGILLIGAYLRILGDVIISMSVFCSMRYWAGGWHSKTHIGCFTSMLIPCVGPAFLKNLEAEWVFPIWICMILYSLYQILRYAPRNSKVNPITNSSILKRKRVGSVVESMILVLIMCFGQNTELKWLVIIPLFVEAITLSTICCG